MDGRVFASHSHGVLLSGVRGKRAAKEGLGGFIPICA